jgi:hypothetical protein
MMMIKENRAGIASAAAIVIGLPHLLGRGSVPVVAIVSIPLAAAIATVHNTTISIAVSTIIVVIIVVG